MALLHMESYLAAKRLGKKTEEDWFLRFHLVWFDRFPVRAGEDGEFERHMWEKVKLIVFYPICYD